MIRNHMMKKHMTEWGRQVLSMGVVIIIYHMGLYFVDMLAQMCFFMFCIPLKILTTPVLSTGVVIDISPLAWAAFPSVGASAALIFYRTCASFSPKLYFQLYLSFVPHNGLLPSVANLRLPVKTCWQCEPSIGRGTMNWTGYDSFTQIDNVQMYHII